MNTVTIKEATRLLHEWGKFLTMNTVTNYIRKGAFKAEKNRAGKYYIEFDSFKIWAFDTYYIVLDFSNVLEWRENPDNYYVQ